MKKEIMAALGQFKSVCQFDGKVNQHEVRFENGVIFQSYDSIIAISFFYRDGSDFSNKIYFGKEWDYSTTTSNHRNRFLCRDSKWCKDMVTKNEILVIDL